MKYLLDTNVLVNFFDETQIFHKNVFDKILNLNSNDELYVSILSLFEFEYNFSTCLEPFKKDSTRKTIDKLKNNEKFNLIGIGEKEAKIFGEIKSLIKNKKGISTKNMKMLNFDIMIASSAISNSCVIVSGDKIFKTISEVYENSIFENWLID